MKTLTQTSTSSIISCDAFVRVSAVLFLFLTSVLVGCSDGGYESTSEPAPTAGTGGSGGAGDPVGLNPGESSGTGGSGGKTTTAAIPYLDLQTFKGCKVGEKPQLSGLVQTANGLQYPFVGLDENSSLPKGQKPSCSGCEFVWASPDPSDQGPIKVSVYSNSGSIKYSAFLDEAKQKPVNVEFYTVQTAKFGNLQLLFQSLTGKEANTQATYDLSDWNKLVLDVWDCQFGDSSCYLESRLKQLKKEHQLGLLEGVFASEPLVGPEAFVNGDFCGDLQVVIRSIP